MYSGAKKRYTNLNDLIRYRIEYELKLINEKGFSPYFLIVEDIVKQTNATIGRGSAAASIVSYCLFITQVDPIKYTLNFQRFIHTERKDMPDIDIPVGTCLTATGQLFRNDVHGIIPQIIQEYYDERVVIKQKIIDAQKEYEDIFLRFFFTSAVGLNPVILFAIMAGNIIM